MSIGERIITLRRAKSISQFQLAQTLGVSRQAVSKWENGQTTPDTLNLIKLADLLDTDVEYLATGTKTEQAPSPIVVNMVKKVDKIVEVEKIVEKPVIKKLVRTRYLRNPIEFLLLGIGCFILGVLVGLIL